MLPNKFKLYVFCHVGTYSTNLYVFGNVGTYSPVLFVFGTLPSPALCPVWILFDSSLNPVPQYCLNPVPVAIKIYVLIFIEQCQFGMLLERQGEKHDKNTQHKSAGQTPLYCAGFERNCTVAIFSEWYKWKSENSRLPAYGKARPNTTSNPMSFFF